MQRILIANRGEIAVRILRTLHEMGLQGVAVYSDADRTALHVLLADLVMHLGPAEAARSYLDMDRILEVAKEIRADAIHPGYGFLSENHIFAEKVRQAGLTFIGPSPEAMQRMGDKIEARKIAERAGVPVIPGTSEGFLDTQRALDAAKNIGFPVLLKARLGGGGKGMRVVHNEQEFLTLFPMASDEAQKAFGDGRIYIEKFIEDPRHVEIQVLADHHGNAIYLGERECSVQRRHQKVLEESPSPALTESLRQEMGEAAVALIQEAGYTNAGTVEFLLDSQGKFYFLEVNARLQVEHPVTEMRFGVDLVKWQILIAQGVPLPFRQRDLSPVGHAVEARIYAEDPYHNFLPSPGTIQFLVEPGGPGVRVDSGIYSGYTVPMHYDPILSKVIAWGIHREEAFQRLKRALQDYILLGIASNLPFHQVLLEHPDLRSGEYTTRILENFQMPKPDPREAIPGAILSQTFTPMSSPRPSVGGSRSRWKSSGFPSSKNWEDW